MSEEVHTSAPGRLIALGEIVGTHGVGGLLRFHPYNESSASLPHGQVVFLAPRTGGALPRPVEVVSARPHGRVVLLRLDGVLSMEAAQALVGSTVSIAEADLPGTTAGEFYAYQLEGLDVFTVGGEHLGSVASLLPTGSNDVLVVRDGAREHLIPLIADVVRSIDVAARRIVIEPIEGLLE